MGHLIHPHLRQQARGALVRWADTATSDLAHMPPSHVWQDTEATPMDAAELHRDSIAAAGQAPRVPRNRPLIPAGAPRCAANGCHQGRRMCINPGECLPSRMDPLDGDDWIAELGNQVVLWLCCVILMVVLPAMVLHITWADVISLLSAIGAAIGGVL